MRTTSPSCMPLTLPLGVSPTMFGAVCGLVSAVLYTLSNICMRKLSHVGCDGNWAICNREIVSFAFVGCWLAYGSLTGRARWPSLKLLGILLAAGLGVQLLGNVGMQWAFHIVGMGFMISSNIIFNLSAGAILGYLLLREALNRRHIAALGILLLAVVMLWLGAKQVDVAAPTAGIVAADARQGNGPVLIAVSLALSAIAGVFYSLQNIAIRHCMKQGVAVSVVVLFITGCGAFTLGPWCLMQRTSPIVTTPWGCYPWMYTAGACNFMAFMALIRGLKYTTVTHVAMISTLQVALAALAGILFFGEPSSPLLLAGVATTILGIVYFGGPELPDAVTSKSMTLNLPNETAPPELATIAEH